MVPLDNRCQTLARGTKLALSFIISDPRGNIKSLIELLAIANFVIQDRAFIEGYFLLFDVQFYMCSI